MPETTEQQNDITSAEEILKKLDKVILRRDTFVTSLLTSYNNWWSWFNVLMNPDQYTQSNGGFSFPKTDKEFTDQYESTRMNPSLRNKQKKAELYLTTYTYVYYKDPTSKQSQDLRDCFNFIKYLGMTQYSAVNFKNYKLILNKLDIFNKETQFLILDRLYQFFNTTRTYNRTEEEFINQIAIAITNNEHATFDTKMLVAERIIKTNQAIVPDLISESKKILDTELKKDFPNIDIIRKICQKVQNLILQTRTALNESTGNIQNPVSIEYLDTVRAEFDFERVLDTNTEYIAKTEKSLEERVAESESKVADAEKRANNAEKRANDAETAAQSATSKFQQLQSSYDELLKQLGEERTKNKQLTEQMNEMENQLEKKDSFIKNLKMKIASLKTTGLFGGNNKDAIKDLQNLIENPTR